MIRALTRRESIQFAAASLPVLQTTALLMASGGTGKMLNPGKAWERVSSPEDAGFHSSGLDAAKRLLFTKPTTSLMVVKEGRIVYSYGEMSHVSYLASARKSVLSMMYGNYVVKGVNSAGSRGSDMSDSSKPAPICVS
jgi:hypothetical protein